MYNNEKRLITVEEAPKYATHVGQIIQSVALDTAAKVQAIYGGTWVAFGAGRTLVGVNSSDSDFNTVNKTGGAKTVTLTVDQMPSHYHDQIETAGQVIYADDNATKGYLDNHSSIQTNRGGGGYQQKARTNYTGGSQPHTNLQPYVTVYMWERTA